MRRLERIVALLTICVSVFLGSLVQRTEKILKASERTDYPLKALYTDTSLKRDVPPFDYSIASLFIRNRNMRIIQPVTKQISIPDLTFIGNIETEKKHIYSFKNVHTDKLVLLEKGIETDGLILIDDTDTTSTLKISGHIFTVEKR